MNFVSSWKSAERRSLVPWRNDSRKKEMFLNSKKMETEFKSENLMQRKIIERQNNRAIQKEKLYGNRVAKLIDKVEQLKQTNNNNNNNNDVSDYFDFDHSLDEKQK